MKKRVLILKSNLATRGGVEKYTYRIAQAFMKNNCDVTVLTTGKIPTSYRNRIDAISLGELSRLSIRNLYLFDRWCKEWIQDHPSDIIFGMDRNAFQTHYRAGNGVHAAYLKRRSLEVSLLKRISFYFNPLHRRLLKIEKLAYEHEDLRCLFTNSDMVRKEILEHYNTDSRKVVTVHNGVEWQELQKDFDVWIASKRLQDQGATPPPYHFLFIGNGYQRKGLHHLLYGLSSLKGEKWILTVAGKDKNRRYFVDLARQLSIDDKIHFVGQTANVRHFYQAADALVIPSLYDPFANVTVEALAMGLFVISSKNNGGHEVLTEDNGTIIEDLNDPSNMIRALSSALEKRKTEASALNIRQNVQHLDFSKQLDKIVHTTLALS